MRTIYRRLIRPLFVRPALRGLTDGPEGAIAEAGYRTFLGTCAAWLLLMAVVAACLALTGCMSAWTKQGPMLKVGESAEAAHEAVIEAENEGKIPKDDLAGTILTIVGILVGGTGAGYGARALVRKTINSAPWTDEEKADIKAIASTTPEPPKA